MIVDASPQGTEAWLSARRGVITGSRFKDVRDRLKNGQPSKACMNYAMDTARERCGGSILPIYANAAMRVGTEQEPIARMAYESATGEFVAEAGFICTDDRKFGVSVDGRIGDRGLWECKTMVSSDTLFTAIVDGDISAYRDQCIGALWLLRCDWIDLHLWVYDLPHLSQVIRINRDEAEIQKLEDDLVEFERWVSSYESRLRAKGTGPARPNASTTLGAGPGLDLQPPREPPTVTHAAAAAPRSASLELPASLF